MLLTLGAQHRYVGCRAGHILRLAVPNHTLMRLSDRLLLLNCSDRFASKVGSLGRQLFQILAYLIPGSKLVQPTVPILMSLLVVFPLAVQHTNLVVLSPLRLHYFQFAIWALLLLDNLRLRGLALITLHQFHVGIQRR